MSAAFDSDTPDQIKNHGKFYRAYGRVGVFIFGLMLINNSLHVSSLENLSGKKLGYWDVFFSGQSIRINTELISKERTNSK